MENQEEEVGPREVDFGDDFSVLEEENESVLMTCWIAYDPAGWLLRCKAAEEDQPIPPPGQILCTDPQEVLAILYDMSERSEEDLELEEHERALAELENRPRFEALFDALYTELLEALLFALPGADQARINFVFQEETELFEERLARRRAENDLDRTYAVRASLPSVQRAIAKLERTLGADVTPVTASKPMRPLQRPTKPFATYRSDASREWWAGVKAALDREVRELSHEEPILGARVEKIDQHLERKGLKLLDEVRKLLPSLRLATIDKVVALRGRLNEAGYEEIGRSLYHEWLGPTKASLLARTSRDKRPPPAPIKELLERSLPTLKEAGKVNALEKVQLDAVRERRELAARALSNLTE